MGAAAEGAAEVLTPYVPGIRDEDDPAMPAPTAIPPQVGLVSQHGAQDGVVHRHESTYLALVVPVRAVRFGRREALLDLYEKNPRASLIILILFFFIALVVPTGEHFVERVGREFFYRSIPAVQGVFRDREGRGRKRRITVPGTCSLA
jgi:hypothetical protein